MTGSVSDQTDDLIEELTAASLPSTFSCYLFLLKEEQMHVLARKRKHVVLS